MTLIVAQASYGFAIQATDRLVTLDRAEFDPTSNKNIVFEAPDAMVAIGYTGDAYLDGQPTDQWLVHRLTGLTQEPTVRPAAARVGPLSHWRHLGPALHFLRADLAQALHRARARERHFELLVTGWQWHRRGRPRPILLSLEKPAGLTTLVIGRSERHFGRRFQAGVAPKDNLPLAIAHQLRAGLRAIRSPDDAEHVMVQAIRAVASDNPLVGPRCLSILLAPPWYPFARVRYISEEVAALELRGRDNVLRGTAPAAYSPWIVGPRLIAAPSIIAGETTYGLGRYSVSVQAPPMAGATPRLLGAFGAVERPPMPR